MITLMVSCGPSNTTNHNQYLTNKGADKKLPDDDGYTGSGGTGDGGGGQGIACSADTKDTTFRSKLFVRDIFEAIYNSKLTPRKPSGPSGENTETVSTEALKFLIEILTDYYGPSIQQLEIGQESFWSKFVSNISFLDEEAKLFHSRDANSPIALPEGCKIVQIAYWDDSTGSSDNGVLYIDRTQWKKLDSLNKVALLAHEYFFKEARRVGYRNSDLVRNRLGYLFSEAPIKPLFPKTGKVQRYCKGTNKADSNAKLHIFQVEDGRQQFLIVPYIASSTMGISSLQGKSFEISPRVGFELEKIVHREKYSPGKAEINAEIWSGYLPSSSSNLKMSLLNSPKEIQSQVRSFSPQLVPAKIFEGIKNTIETRSKELLKKQVSVDEVILMRAFAILTKEIEDHLKDGIPPSNFPKWNAEIIKIVAPLGHTQAGTLADWSITDGYPRLLYKSKVGLLSESEFHTLFLTNGRSITERDTISLARIEMENRSYDYEMTCFDANSIAISLKNNNVLNGPPVRGETPGLTDIPYKVDYAKFAGSSKSTDESGQEDPWASWEKEDDRSDEEKLNSKIKETLNGILNSYIESKDFCDLKSIDGCSPGQRLSYKLRRTRYVNLHRCYDYSNFSHSSNFEVIEQHRVKARRCLVIEIPEEKMFYMVEQEGPWSQDLNRYDFELVVTPVGPPTYPAETIKEAGSP